MNVIKNIKSSHHNFLYETYTPDIDSNGLPCGKGHMGTGRKQVSLEAKYFCPNMHRLKFLTQFDFLNICSLKCLFFILFSLMRLLYQLHYRTSVQLAASLQMVLQDDCSII